MYAAGALVGRCRIYPALLGIRTPGPPAEAIDPDAERMFARRMRAETVEVASSHVAMVSHPDAVVALIEAAANATAGAPAVAGTSA